MGDDTERRGTGDTSDVVGPGSGRVDDLVGVNLLLARPAATQPDPRAG